MGLKCTRWPAGKYFDKNTVEVCWFNHFGDPESSAGKAANQKDKQRWKNGTPWNKKDWAQWFNLSEKEQKDCEKGKGTKGKGPKGTKGDGKGKGPKGKVGRDRWDRQPDEDEDNKTDPKKDDEG